MILGIDVGSFATKTSEKKIFQSGVVENGIRISKTNTHELRFISGNAEKNYTVGTSNEIGNISVEINKSINHYAPINFLAACALSLPPDSTSNISISCVTGLPISQFSKNKELYAEMLSFKNQIVWLDGEKKMFTTTCKVFPEGAASIYHYGADKFINQRVLILDIGGLTINAVEFLVDGGVSLQKYKSLKKGTFVFYSILAEQINSEFGVNKTVNDIPDLLSNGFYINGVPTNISALIKKTAHDYCFGIYNELNLLWSTKDFKNIILTGGGSIVLGEYIKNYIPHAVTMPNPQFSNALGYKIIASEIFK